MVDYNPNIPQSNDNLSTSQGQMLNNFGQLNTIFDANHITYDNVDVTHRGHHRKVDFPATTSVSAPAGLSSVLFTKNISGVPCLYFDNSAGSSVVWRSNSSSNGLVNATSGEFTFPNGFGFNYGQTTTNGSGDATIPWGFPNNLFCAILTRVITGGNNRGFVQWGSPPTKVSGAVRMLDSAGTGIAGTFYWFAIGN